MNDKKFLCIAIAIFLLFWLLVFLNLSNEFLDLRGDSAQYIILAENIAKGIGYHATGFPSCPFFYHYPPIFPWILSCIIYFFGRNYYLMQFLIATLGYISLIFLYRIFRKHLPLTEAFTAIVLLIFNWFFVYYSAKYITSEIPYLFFTTLTIFSAERFVKNSKTFSFWGIITLMGVILSYFTRYIGITLFFAILVYIMLFPQKNRYKKIFFILTGFFIPFIAWHIIVTVLNPQAITKYFNQFSTPHVLGIDIVNKNVLSLILNFFDGLKFYYDCIGSIFFIYFVKKSSWIFLILTLLFIILTIYGLVIYLRKNKKCLFTYYFLIYFLVIILWPYREEARFLLPIMPFIIFYFLIGLKSALSPIINLFSPKIFYFLVFFLIIFNIPSLPYKPKTYNDLPNYFKNFITIHYWIKNNLNDDGIILCFKPQITYFYTQHKAVGYPFNKNPDALWQGIKANHIKYIIIDEFSLGTRLYLGPVINKYKTHLKLIHTVGETGLFELSL